MRILGWMHRKLPQSSGDIFKDFASVVSCNCLSGRPSLEDHHHHHHHERPRLWSLGSVRDRGEFGDEELAGSGGDQAIDAALLGGLLAIGTLGSAPIHESTDPEAEDNGEDDPPPTPAFGGGGDHLVDAIAEKSAEATTESDLMLVSTELEKVLAAEDHRVSSARMSHVSAMSAADACPLQGYLFGSPIEVAENAPKAPKAGGREKRASLGELFMRSRVADKEEATAKDVGGDVGRSPASVHLLVRRMLKGRGSTRSKPNGGPPDKSSSVTKFQKILKMFYRKVHPESTVAAKKSFKLGKSEIKANTVDTEASDSSCYGRSDTVLTNRGGCRDELIPSYKCHSNPQSFALIGSHPNGNHGYWIKTDADYLVLEL